MRYTDTGRISSITLDLATHKPAITISVDGDGTEDLTQLAGCGKVDVIIKNHKDRRSLDANAYYWCLLTKLARVHGLSNPECHNILLQKYGQFERINGKLVTILIADTEESEREARGKSEYHIRPTSQVTSGTDGKMYRVYVLMRGSHTYDTQEMARLISGLIDDCRQSGISDSEIMTPREKEQLRELYGIGGENDEVKENESL